MDGQTEFELIERHVRRALDTGPLTSADIEAQTSRPPPKVLTYLERWTGVAIGQASSLRFADVRNWGR